MEPPPSKGSCSSSYLHPLARQLLILLHPCLLVVFEQLVTPRRKVDTTTDSFLHVLEEVLEGSLALVTGCLLVVLAELHLDRLYLALSGKTQREGISPG